MKQSIHKIKLKKLKKAMAPSIWDKGNKVLYDLCNKYPSHIIDEEILAKVWLIGRSYSASIERGNRNSEYSGDKFYAEVVVPRIKNSRIDNWLDDLSGYKKANEKNCLQIIAVHSRVTNLFREISGLEKRSLASKYLHFHLPKLFFIYDSRASKSLGRITRGLGRRMPEFREYDEAYAKFFLRCLALVNGIYDEYEYRLNTRQLDNYLLSLADDQ